MNLEREYRLEACRCLLAAEGEPDAGQRISLIKTASAWLEVAVNAAIDDQGKSAIAAQLSNLDDKGHVARRLMPIVRLVR